jgi:hypothetical protein
MVPDQLLTSLWNFQYFSFLQRISLEGYFEWFDLSKIVAKQVLISFSMKLKVNAKLLTMDLYHTNP